MTKKDFEKKWIDMIDGGLLKRFPDEYVDVNFEEVQMPGKTIVMGSELFGQYEVVDGKGNAVFHAKDIYEAKFLLYANRNKPEKIKKPSDSDGIKEIVKKYEKKLDDLLLDIRKDFKKTFPEDSGFDAATNNIFNTMELKRY